MKLIGPQKREEALSPADLQTNHRMLSNQTTPILGGVMIVTVIIFVGGWLGFCFRKKLSCSKNFKINHKADQSHVGCKLNPDDMRLRRFSFQEIKKATDNFSEASLIGSGAFGDVYRGTFDDLGTLAIKKARDESYATTEDFRNEVNLISKVKHQNLVQLLGFCEQAGPSGAKILVYEYAPNGSLLDYITGRAGRSLTWMQRVKIAIGAAKGIAHLHEGMIPSIIHRDIKPSNILIGDDFDAKVSDFGLVRCGPVGDNSHVSSQVKGTPGYLDPAYCSSYHLSPFTDVYSFGVILLQLVTARPAVKSSSTSAKSHIIDWARPSIEEGSIGDIIDVDLVIEGGCANMDMMLKMGQLALKCVVKNPKERPTMTQLWQELESALDSSSRVHDQCSLLNNHEQLIDDDHYYDQSSQSINISVDSVRLQRFVVDIDSFESATLRCLEKSMSIDADFDRC